MGPDVPRSPHLPAPDEPPVSDGVLLSGDYEYLTDGYYECQDAELRCRPGVLPTCADALDAYVVPIALVKADKAGIAVPKWVLTNESFPIPAVCYGVNPFTRKYAVVRTEREREMVARHLTWNFKYAMCCQSIGPDSEVIEFRMVGPRTEQQDLAPWAERVFEVFRIPLAKVRLLRNGRLELSAIEILPYRFLTPNEREWAKAMAESAGG
jgi:hypothetical protein